MDSRAEYGKNRKIICAGEGEAAFLKEYVLLLYAITNITQKWGKNDRNAQKNDQNRYDADIDGAYFDRMHFGGQQHKQGQR